jgi:hypothetical protein
MFNKIGKLMRMYGQLGYGGTHISVFGASRKKRKRYTIKLFFEKIMKGKFIINQIVKFY